MFLRRTSPLRRLCPEAPRHPRLASRASAHQTEFLLRSRRLSGRERHHRRCASSAARSTWAPSSSSSAPCGKGRHHAESVSSPLASASISGPSLAGRSSGANTFPNHTSGRSRAPASRQLSNSSASHTRSWTPSSAVIPAAEAGHSCSGSSHRSRSREAFKSRSRIVLRRSFFPAEDVVDMSRPLYGGCHSSFTQSFEEM